MDEQRKHEEFARLCRALGEDFDAPVCKELEKHIAECPECRIVFDTVKRVVYLYRVVEKPTDIPQDVQERLFRVLNLPRPERKD